MTSECEDEHVIWEPMAGSQETVLAHDWVFELLYHGNRGPGKSSVLLMDFAQHCGVGFGEDWRGVIFRQTFPQLQDLLAKSRQLFPKIFPGIRWVGGSRHAWIWPDGEELMLRQFGKDDDYWKYHGWELPFIGWDELVNWPTMNGYRRMISCCRSSNPDVPRKIRSTTNSYGPGHNIVKFYFELPAKDNIIRERIVEIEDPVTGKITRDRGTRLAIKGMLRENTVLLKADPGYLARMAKAARNPAELAAWVDGSWDIVAGGMFDDVWSAQYNIVKPFDIPHTWRVDRSFDWGSSKPFSVGWWAESDGTDYIDGHGQQRSSVRGDLYRIGEWYGWNGEPNEGLRMLAVDVARGIREREFKHWPNLKIRSGPADSQIFTIENGKDISADMSAKLRLANGSIVKGVAWTRADKSAGSRKIGWEAVRKMIAGAHPPKEGGPREKPGLFVFATCDQFIRTVPVLPRDDNDLDDVDTNAEDHIGDEVRYKVRSLGTAIRSGRTRGHT